MFSWGRGFSWGDVNLNLQRLKTNTPSLVFKEANSTTAAYFTVNIPLDGKRTMGVGYSARPTPYLSYQVEVDRSSANENMTASSNGRVTANLLPRYTTLGLGVARSASGNNNYSLISRVE